MKIEQCGIVIVKEERSERLKNMQATIIVYFDIVLVAV